MTELEDFLNILDKENLSSAAILKKCLLSEILQMCLKNNSSGDEEYIYMNKVLAPDPDPTTKPDSAERSDLPAKDALTNGVTAPPPQKSLPDLPPPKIIPEKTQSPKADTQEGYYEEAEPYDPSAIEDGEAISSSYESYEEEENTRGKSAAHQHQWPSTEASIELMKDALICAFLWRKKWLGQWAKQLCVIKDNRLMCYKSSKEHSPVLDISLLGCSVTHKEKQVRKKEHKLKITPTNGDMIVLGMQSREQALQWLKVIQDITGTQSESIPDSSMLSAENQRPANKGEVTDRYSAASESGSSTDGHPETPEVKEVKKKGSSGLKLSNLMNLGRKKSASMDSPEKTLETSNYLNVLINSHWKSRYCCVKDGQLHVYQDRNKSKTTIQPVSLIGCDIIPQPTPDHLYSFRILHNGEELATLEAKSSEDMGHWLGLLLSESGSKTDPEEFSYDYVDAERVSCIVSAAKNSFFLMQRKYSEPNTYIDNPRGGRSQQDDLYDDVDVSDTMEEDPKPEVQAEEENTYLDLLPAKSFLHGSGMKMVNTTQTPSPTPERANKTEREPDPAPILEPEPASPAPQDNNHHPEEVTQDLQVKTIAVSSPLLGKCKTERTKASSPAIENKLGKNRTEAEARKFTEVKEKLEKEREEIREVLAALRKERRELKESIATCADKSLLTGLEEKLKRKEEECKVRENQRVDLELQIVEVKENLRKAELGPVTLGTAVEPAHLDSPSSMKCCSPIHIPDSSPVNSAVALKSRPLSIMTTGKGTVLQKAKEWEKKGAS
ncbi:actin filament-associated protein 1-like 2 isoform X2 [Hyla sarda]|nr:actin filament-associated protein 1-like 2 isoform X2 [Hyla sarda]XP_056385589.1 actin filament-associated protein 1-like 2 isoform X2 [Hyla sarda]XP_056385590.1 actin filament-associated protein 1-like 2 isoform X2 [Hyla sarda]